MIEKVRNTIEKNYLLEKGDKVTVGLSGGADSVSLMSVLYKLKDEYDLTLQAVHVNHGIRGEEAKRDEDFVVGFCKTLGVPLSVFHKDIPSEAAESGESEEECGRRIRYECFESVCDGGKIATAHTLSDSIETMIFNMLRGSSTAGLCSIPVRRENIIRPLIDCTREEIEQYCSKNGLEYVTDSTNLETEYTRNYIRREIMPMFGRINRSYMTALARLKDFVCEDNAYLEKTALELLKYSKTENGIDLSKIMKYDLVLVKRAVVYYIKEICGISPESRHVNFIIENASHNFALQLNKEYFVAAENGLLYAYKRSVGSAEKPESKKIIIGSNRFGEYEFEVIRLSRDEFMKNYRAVSENAVDTAKIKGEISVRGRQEGDSLFLFRRKVTKSLKKLFSEMKLPTEQRDIIPVVCDESDVLWVYGVGANGKYTIDDATSEILFFRLK